MAQDWTKLFDEHGPALLLYARQWARSRADAEEAVQDGFVRFWRSKYRHEENPVPLIFTAVKRSAIDHARSRTRRVNRERRAHDEQSDKVALFKSNLDADERREQLETVMSRLPEEQREVLVMKIWGDLKFREIAQSLGIPQNTAASRYRYALGALRDALGGDTQDD